MKKINQRSYKKALIWIVKILRKHKIKFNILGGLAAYAYGSKRMLIDIDIAMKNENLRKIIPDVKDYLIEYPHLSKSKNWICYFMELRYKGITIEISGDKGCKMLNSKTKKWENLGDILSKPLNKRVLGLTLPVIPKKRLIAYKSRLMRKIDKFDIKNIK